MISIIQARVAQGCRIVVEDWTVAGAACFAVLTIGPQGETIHAWGFPERREEAEALFCERAARAAELAEWVRCRAL